MSEQVYKTAQVIDSIDEVSQMLMSLLKEFLTKYNILTFSTKIFNPFLKVQE